MVPVMRKQLTYFGILRSITSWAKVSRELISALIRLGTDINIFERKGFLFDKNFPLDYTIKEKITNQLKSDIIFTFENPRTYVYLPKTSYTVGFLVYEFSILPDSWVNRINKRLDLVIVPSNFCKNNFIQSGVDKKKIKVLRYGFNPQYYFPRTKAINTGRFTFVSFANPHRREGIELLLESFCKAFTKKDPVQLILKLTYTPKGKIKQFEYTDIQGLCNSYITKPHTPCIKVIDTALTEKQVGDLYRSADCYVSLSRAEAFGMCFLEALACGLPVAAVNRGGQSDYLNTGNTFFIKHSLVKAHGEEYEKMKNPGLLALPDIDDAVRIFRYIFNNQKEALRKAQSFKPKLKYYLWKIIAKDFLRLIA